MRFTGATYSDAELAWIKANATRPRIEMHAEFCRIFDRPDVTFESLRWVRLKNGWACRDPKSKGRRAFRDEYVQSDGYLLIRLPKGRRVFKHKHLWEAVNGPLPDGMALKCRGDKLNTDPSNWEPVPRQLLSYFSGNNGIRYENLPDEIKLLMMASVVLKHRLRTVRANRETTQLR